MHRTLSQTLSALLFQDQPELWAEKLPYVELAINSATNATTWKPAFELLHENNIDFPIDLAIGTDTTHPKPLDFATKVRNLVREAQEQIVKSQHSQKQQYDKRHRHLEFNIGQ